MGYLERLIERAIDTNLDLENNQIGNYKITPQHGRDLVIYHLYKDGTHISTIMIVDNKVNISVSRDISVNEVEQIRNTLTNLYSSFVINLESFPI